VFRWNGEPLLHISLIAGHVPLKSRLVGEVSERKEAVSSGRCAVNKKNGMKKEEKWCKGRGSL
jgi:hypothetical protein